MEKNLYIDASHPNETRIVLKSNNSIEEYEFEDKNNLNFKNNFVPTQNQEIHSQYFDKVMEKQTERFTMM